MYCLQVKLCQKLFFCRTWGEHVVYKNCSECQKQFPYTTCSPVWGWNFHVCIELVIQWTICRHIAGQLMQKWELLTKIYLYDKIEIVRKSHLKINQMHNQIMFAISYFWAAEVPMFARVGAHKCTEFILLVNWTTYSIYNILPTFINELFAKENLESRKSRSNKEVNPLIFRATINVWNKKN